MIYPVNYFEAKCDNCGEEWHDEAYGFKAMSDEHQTAEMLMNAEWHFGNSKANEGRDGEHYCPNCFYFDDDDQFHLKPTPTNKH